MVMVPYSKVFSRGLAASLVAGLVVLVALVLAGCANNPPAQVSEGPPATAVPAVPTPAAQSDRSSSGAAGGSSGQVSASVLQSPPSTPPLQVVTTTNFVGDWARVVGGDRAEVFALLPPGGDPHSFVPGGADVARVADADVVFTVGLGLEANWLHYLVRNARADESTVIELGEFVDPMEFSGPDLHGHGEAGHEEEAGHMEAGHEEPGHEAEAQAEADHEEPGHEEEAGHDEMGHDDHGHGAEDPHFWFDPIRVKLAINEMAAQLSYLDPENADTYYVNADAYGDELDELHAWIQGHVEMVPPERRLLVTSHDSLGYLAEAYGFEVVGLVIPSLAPDVEPSAEHLSEVIEAVRENNVPAVFGETTVSDRLALTIAQETGAELVQLYSGSMGVEGSGADTYVGMVRTNVERIVEALK